MPDVVDNFSRHLRNVLTRALCLLVEQGGAAIEPEHLLWSVAAEQGSVGSEILRKAQVTEERLGAHLGIASQGSVESARQHADLPQLSEQSKRAIEKAVLIASMYEHPHVGTEHLVAGMLQIGSASLAQVLKAVDAQLEDIRMQLATIFKGTQQFPQVRTSNTSLLNLQHEESPLGLPESEEREDGETQALEYFATELTDPETAKQLDPVIGRDQEIQRVMEVLSRRTKNNPVLIGEPGVGKTAIVEGLAKRIVEGTVPASLQGKRLYALDLTSLVAGTMYRGEFEGRLKQIVEEVREHPEIILFIDELHTLMGAGSGSGSLDAANMLKPALARGWIRCIGATTPDEYKKSMETDGALERRFQSVPVAEPSAKDTIAILRSLAPLYEAHHQVTITDEALVFAVEASQTYVHDRFLPDKAIDLLDEAASALHVSHATTVEETPQLLTQELRALRRKKRLAIQEERFLDASQHKAEEEELMQRLEQPVNTSPKPPLGTVDVEAIARVIERQTGVRVRELVDQERQALQRIERTLKTAVVGQDTVVRDVARHIRRVQLGLHTHKRPLASFLFVGPSGTGKTELATQLANIAFHREDALIRLDMSAFSEPYAVSKLIGSPAGYVGYRDRNLLTDPVKARPHSVVLFDEIEKAHPDVHHLLLQILEHGQLQDATGRHVSFRNCLIVLTSNVGSTALLNGSLGFSAQGVSTKDVQSSLKDVLRSELLNRIDTVGVFRPLEAKALRKVAERELKKLQQRLKQEAHQLSWERDVTNHLVEQCQLQQAGARPLRQLVEHLIAGSIADTLIEDPSNRDWHLSINNNQIDVARKTR